MEESLYSEYGFFNNEKIRSKKTGDFLTSPEVSEFFGNLIETWMNNNSILGTIVEFGSGTGSLINNFSEEKKKRLTAIEKSSTARFELNKLGIPVFDSISKLKKQKIDLIFGNEILDNIPCSIAIYKDNNWFEKGVDLSKDYFSYKLLPIRDKEFMWLNDNKIVGNEEIEIEIQTNINEFIASLIEKFQPNNFLFIYYVYLKKNISKRNYTSLLRTYKNHHLAVEPIENFGNVDITYDINFSALEKLFSENGYKVTLSKQKEFLEECGALALLKKLQKLFLKSEGIEQLKIKDKILGVNTILDPNGLGGFYVLRAKKV
jgi:NADH dehydrogenase [ubiquinone] 1 alpha subcomplex assembly factor 7